MLSAKYLGFIILGIISLVSGGIESINLATFDGYTFFWSYGIIISAAVAGFGSLREVWEGGIEKWGALALFSLLGVWSVAALIRAIGEGDLARVNGAVAILLLCMLPGARAFGLLRKHGIRS
jgi:predicted membrane channel-forming protein YqfA (hemolysin III family)